MGIIGIILSLIGAAFIGIMIGLIAVSVFSKISKSKMRRDAKKIMEGNKTNVYNLDGKMINVNPISKPAEKKSSPSPKGVQVK